jgi:hypothetical protein
MGTLCDRWLCRAGRRRPIERPGQVGSAAGCSSDARLAWSWCRPFGGLCSPVVGEGLVDRRSRPRAKSSRHGQTSALCVIVLNLPVGIEAPARTVGVAKRSESGRVHTFGGVAPIGRGRWSVASRSAALWALSGPGREGSRQRLRYFLQGSVGARWKTGGRVITADYGERGFQHSRRGPFARMRCANLDPPVTRLLTRAAECAVGYVTLHALCALGAVPVTGN